MSSAATFDPSCEFCAIARGESQSAEVVCKGDAWLALFPLDPATPGHTLVIPRAHIANLWDAELDLGTALMEGVIQVGRAIGAALSPEGMNMITSSGAAAEQTVFHLHLHVVPRWRRDGFGPIWPTGGKYEDADLDDVAQRILEACQSV
jgi:histidine triad (HIT) family protein